METYAPSAPEYAESLVETAPATSTVIKFVSFVALTFNSLPALTSAPLI